jgi:hypothetical protein
MTEEQPAPIDERQPEETVGVNRPTSDQGCAIAAGGCLLAFGGCFGAAALDSNALFTLSSVAALVFGVWGVVAMIREVIGAWQRRGS